MLTALLPDKWLRRAASLLLLCMVTTVARGGDDTLRVVFTGDVLLDRGVRRFIEHRGVDALFTPGVEKLFSSSDIVVGNLECPATVIRQPVYKRFIFRAEPQWLQALRMHGFTHLGLANNHSIDQGRAGLMDTQRNIRAAGMTPVGAGSNLQEAVKPVLLAEKPRKVFLLATLGMTLENFAYLPGSPCVAQESADSLAARVASLRRIYPDSYIIVMPHWGWEHHTEVIPHQRMVAHALIDAGADLIVGHHTHTLQPSENYRGRIIYYGIGNFIFDQTRPLNTRACVVCLHLTATQARTEALLVLISDCVPHIVRP